MEGHGTGTRVGDKVELEALASALQEDGVTTPRQCGMTSFKSIVGHTKAAAGVGAFIKAVIAANRRVLPPTACCSQPNAVFDTTALSLYPILEGEVKAPTATVCAGVSAMGFGGINSHVTLQSGDAPSPRLARSGDELALLASNQETELFVFGDSSVARLRSRLAELAKVAELLSVGELTDLAAKLGAECQPGVTVRAAVIAGKPEELAERLREMESALQQELPAGETRTGSRKDWFVSHGVHKERLGFLLPGQGSQQLAMASVLVRRYPWARELVAQADQWMQEMGEAPLSPIIFRSLARASGPDERDRWARDLARTEVAQPSICLASLLYSRHLANLGLRLAAVGGHSLGELTAFHLAGAFDEETLLKLAALRGRAMASTTSPAGAMLSLACDRLTAETLLARTPGYVVVANVNSPCQTVVSGEEPAVAEVMRLAEAEGIACRLLNVSNAFHSRLVEDAADRLRSAEVVPEKLGALTARLFSSMGARSIQEGLDLRRHFADQVLAQVDFIGLVERMKPHCDLFLEVGPGRVLSGLVADMGTDEWPCLSLASQPGADRDLNRVLAQAFVNGVDVSWPALYEGRLVRPFVPASERLFIDNPCERPFQMPAGVAAAAEDAMPAGALEALFAEATESNGTEIQAYLARRGSFLADVVKADMRSLNGSLVTLPVKPVAKQETAPPLRKPEAEAQEAHAPPAPAASCTDSLETLLVNLAAERTGFPRETITLQTKLLDDLNLDSIKAAELVASAARQKGVAGKIDPSRLANATLGEVVAAIQAVAGEETVAVRQPDVAVVAPAIVDDSPGWVRNFVIDFVEAA